MLMIYALSLMFIPSGSFLQNTQKPETLPVADKPVLSVEVDPEKLGEQDLFNQIIVRSTARINLQNMSSIQQGKPEYQRALYYIDVFLKRFPDSKYRDIIYMSRLKMLHTLAYTERYYYEQLQKNIFYLKSLEPTGKLAEEVSFYEVQAFIMGSKLEKMPEHIQLKGAAERYRAFAFDFPESKRVPIMMASYIRCLIKLENLPEAKIALDGLEGSFPDNPATTRALGEYKLASSVGKPFQITAAISDGTSLDTSVYRGTILILSFWKSTDKDFHDTAAHLSKIRKEFEKVEVSMAHVIMNSRPVMKHAAKALFTYSLEGEHHFESKGFGSPVVLENGIISVPTHLVFDADGKLRFIHQGTELDILINQLLDEKKSESKKKSVSNKPEPKK